MIKFSEYFNKWLYDKDGYYSNYKVIGKEGDFYTSVSTSSFFGGSIAKRIIQTIDAGFLAHNTTIVEVGAHHGYLLADIIQFIYTLRPELLQTLQFIIIERFDTLQQKQTQYLKESFGDAIQLQHYKSIDAINLEHAFVVANEIFDAFSCELLYTNNRVLEQAYVNEINHDIQFKICEDTQLIENANKYKITKGEYPVGYDAFAKSLITHIKKFEFLTFDYGDEYPRNDFSCRIYEKHNVYPLFQGRFKGIDLNNQEVIDGEKLDFSKLYKKSDITYDVNFTILKNCFEDLGAKEVVYETQLKALVRFGITELLEILHKNVDETTYLREANKVKTLLEPTGMGDRFKCAIFRNGL